MDSGLLNSLVNIMRKLHPFIPYAVLVILPLVMVLSKLGEGQILYGSDYNLLFYYSRDLARQMLAQGDLPLWDPHMFAGFPLLATLQLGLFYPLTWVSMLFESGATKGMCLGKCNSGGADCQVPDATTQLSKCTIQDSNKQLFCGWLCEVQGKTYKCPNDTDYKCISLGDPNAKYCAPK